MREWTNEQIKNIQLYGKCPSCGAPVMKHFFTETDIHGNTHSWVRLLCSEEPINHYKGEKDG